MRDIYEVADDGKDALGMLAVLSDGNFHHTPGFIFLTKANSPLNDRGYLLLLLGPRPAAELHMRSRQLS
jgi:hypothetical protein